MTIWKGWMMSQGQERNENEGQSQDDEVRRELNDFLDSINEEDDREEWRWQREGFGITVEIRRTHPGFQTIVRWFTADGPELSPSLEQLDEAREFARERVDGILRRRRERIENPDPPAETSM